MNCFFASCEIAQNPDLKGKKLAVGRFEDGHKGIVLACSYEAKAYGITAAMPFTEALRRCPDLVIVDPHMGLYSDYSRKFFDYFLSITPLVEPGSIDEAYLDVTDVCAPSLIVDLAHDVQNDILNMFNLPCSIGIAPNKFLAKMASDMKKPLGITVLRKREIDKLLWPLPISDMFGVGKNSKDSFVALGIKTIGDLANYKDLKLLSDVLGPSSAEALYKRANGEGSNEVDVSRFNEVSSISTSQTLERDEYDEEKMLLHIHLLSNSVSKRLEQAGVKAYTFTLQIKYFNFRQVSRSKTLHEATNDANVMFRLMKELFDDLYEEGIPVRLFGVGASKFTKYEEEVKQLSLFDNLDQEQKDHNISLLLSSINKTVGTNIIKKGVKNNSDPESHSLENRFVKHNR